MKGKALAVWMAALWLGVFWVGCAEVVKVGTTVGAGMGKISAEDKAALDRLADQTAKAVRPMTDQEEYYVGRAVGATILGQYKLSPSPRLNEYVNSIGALIALASNRPTTFGGYHFAVLDTEEVNALACPGGTIFVTRGMIKNAQREDDLAAILAHEVAHVNHKDGLASIQKSRWAQAVTLLGTEAARKVGGADFANLVSLFEGSVGDVTKTLLVKGYSREQEIEADGKALIFLQRLGYDPHALYDTLDRMAKEQSKGKGGGIFSTHPGMDQRLLRIKATLSQNQWPRRSDPVRDRRFREWVG